MLVRDVARSCVEGDLRSTCTSTFVLQPGSPDEHLKLRQYMSPGVTSHVVLPPLFPMEPTLRRFLQMATTCGNVQSPIRAGPVEDSEVCGELCLFKGIWDMVHRCSENCFWIQVPDWVAKEVAGGIRTQKHQMFVDQIWLSIIYAGSGIVCRHIHR